MMMAAALTAGQAFAAEPGPGPTLIEGGLDGYFNENEYDGQYSDASDVSGVKLTISETDPSLGKDASGVAVYGGFVGGGYNSTGNTILMTGGEVRSLAAASTAWGDGSGISGNKVILTGGKAFSIEGASNYGASGTLTGNHAVITGGHVGGDTASELGHLWGGYSDTGITAANNTVSLVGNGASITVDGQEYQGHALTINANISAGTADGTGNALDIYGKDITLGGGISGTQAMNFYLVDGLSDNTAMLTHMDATNLNLTNVTTYGFDGSAVANWAAYDGKSIMLIESYNGQIMGVGDSTEVEIKGADGTTVAMATLGLTDGGKALALSNIVNKSTPTPEPTTGVLSLLALAAFAGRKRK